VRQHGALRYVQAARLATQPAFAARNGVLYMAWNNSRGFTWGADDGSDILLPVPAVHVVRVLPDVDGEKRLLAGRRDRRLGVGGLLDLELAALEDEPRARCRRATG
jgi:hypothetical protein